MIKKTVLILIIVVFCKGSIFAQNNSSRPDEGSCKDIVDNLRKVQKNDSVAIEIFKVRYQIFDMPDSLLIKNHVGIIQYVNSEEGKDCFCRSRIIIIKPDYPLLLMDISQLSSGKGLLDD